MAHSSGSQSSRRHASKAESSIVVVGTARNCAQWIAGTIANLQEALSGFRRVQWLIVESDSDDDTPAQLQALSRRMGQFEVRHLGMLRTRLPLRTERLAYCRNTYLNELKSPEAYRDVDYVLVVDLDGLTNALTAAGIASCWDRLDWDACAANQRGPYYDIWALRHTPWSPNDCWEQVRLMKALGVCQAEAEAASVYSRIVNIPETADWIEVESAFGGLAIYRRAAIVLGTYNGLSSKGEEVCEHVALHRDLRAAGAVIFLNPRLVNHRCAFSYPQGPAEGLLRGIKVVSRRVFGEEGVARISIMARRLLR